LLIGKTFRQFLIVHLAPLGQDSMFSDLNDCSANTLVSGNARNEWTIPDGAEE
jgi:hypothetical protein